MKKKKVSKQDKAVNKLKEFYKRIPDTVGCMDCLNSEKSCKAWCCNVQSPSVLKCEFLNMWNSMVQSHKNKSVETDFVDVVIGLIRKSLHMYLYNPTVKSCVFRDKETYLCKEHEARCFSCRTYGIVPKKEFTERLQKTKKHATGIFHDQCDKVKTVDGKDELDQEVIDLLWSDIVDIESELVGKENVHDKVGGTYRTYHEHVCIFIFPESMMADFSQIRSMGNNNDKEQAIEAGINYYIHKLANALVEPKRNENG